MTRRTVVLSGVCLTVVVGLVVGALLVRPGRHHSQPVASPSAAALPTAPATPAPPLDPGRATRMASDLASGTDAGVRDAVALPPTQPLDPAAAARLKALGRVTFDVKTFHNRTDGIATVTAHLPGGNRWNVTLIDENGQWKIGSARELS